MSHAVDLAIVVGQITVFFAGVWALSAPAMLFFDTRTSRIWSCIATASAFALMYEWGLLARIANAGPIAEPWGWAGLLLFATLFTYGATLEVASWFGFERR